MAASGFLLIASFMLVLLVLVYASMEFRGLFPKGSGGRTLIKEVHYMLGLTVFGETLDPARLACFTLIWAAIALYSWDMLRRSRA